MVCLLGAVESVRKRRSTVEKIRLHNVNGGFKQSLLRHRVTIT